MDKTKDPVNQHGFDVQSRIGQTRLGVLKNWEWYDDPKRFLFSMARYKFAAKMLAGRKNVLEIGCGDAYNAPIMLQAVERLTVTDFDPLFIADAKSRVNDKWKYDAHTVDILKDPVPGSGSYDAIYSMDVLEHIPTDQEHVMLEKISNALTPNGIALIGMPSIESQLHASAASKAGHINCKTGPDLKAVMEKHFHSVFLFSMNDEVVHTGFHKMAHYLLALCAHKKS